VTSIQPDTFWIHLGDALLGIVILIALPIVGLQIVKLVWRIPSLAFFHQIPILHRTAALAGTALGLGTLFASANRPSFDINVLFAKHGPWDMAWRQFIFERADPALYAYDGLWERLFPQPDGFGWMLLGLGLASAAVLMAVVSVLLLRGVEILIAWLGIAFTVLVAQAMTIYLAMLLSFTVHSLNFWTPLALLVVLQYFRYAGHRSH